MRYVRERYLACLCHIAGRGVLIGLYADHGEATSSYCRATFLFGTPTGNAFDESNDKGASKIRGVKVERKDVPLEQDAEQD